MASPDPTVRLAKRRRTNRKAGALVEGDDSTLDTAMYQDLQTGPTRHKIIVPVRLDQPSRQKSQPEPDPDPISDDNLETDGQNVYTLPKTQQKTRSYYMKEFVSRISSILQAIQAREALPDLSTCSNCHTRVGKWRCQDCSYGKIMCRKCMRHSHFTNPFHRVARWTGTYFRDAALWEVGVYLTVAHGKNPGICANLRWQEDTLENFQKQRDCADDFQHHPTSSVSEDVIEPNVPRPDADAEPEPVDRDDATRDAAVLQYLDRLLEGRDVDEMLEGDEDHDITDTEADILDIDAGVKGFVGYVGVERLNSGSDPCSGTHSHVPNSGEQNIPVAPQRDALNNQYVRVVHTNGLHHIALVSCSCRGQENMIMDLIFAQLIPTSFDRIRTLFTTALLDHFRYCNLDMKSSSYQFFQLLRRITMPMNPAKVVNLYHELRRLSRLWRWTKKLKWAGFAQQPDQPVNPNPGELGIYCPACPQIGKNVAANWLQDPNRWVYRRVLTADGNFKANHVRQKRVGEDIWLYDGLGMTARRSEYESFLKQARELTRVSRV